jgi:hypothetical protein
MIDIHYESENHRTISDDENPRIYSEEWECCECGLWVTDEEVVWATPEGILSTDTGKPYCVGCTPEEKE